MAGFSFSSNTLACTFVNTHTHTHHHHLHYHHLVLFLARHALGKAVEHGLAFIQIGTVHTNVDARVGTPRRLKHGMDDHAALLLVLHVVRRHLLEQFRGVAVKARLAAAPKEADGERGVLVGQALERHERGATARDARVNVHEVAAVFRIEQDIDSAKAKETEAVAVLDDFFDKGQLQFLELVLVFQNEVGIRTKAAIRFAVIFVGTEPNDAAIGVHEKVAGDVASNVDKVGDHVGGVSRILEKLQKLFLIVVILNDKNALGAHGMGRFDDAGANRFGV